MAPSGSSSSACGRRDVAAALSGQGAADLPVVACYLGIYVRDHWSELTSLPWWYAQSPDIEQQLAWHRAVYDTLGCDWIPVPSCLPRDVRQRLSVETTADGVWRVDRESGKWVRLEPPRKGGWTARDGVESVKPNRAIDDLGQLAEALPDPPPFDAKAYRESGCCDLADRLLAEFGDRFYRLVHVGSPLWMCYALWGYEGFMVRVAECPKLVAEASRRYLVRALRAVEQAAALGADGVWIEECLTDQIRPSAFERLCLPRIQALVTAVRAAGMQSIYYYCGDPNDRWDLLLASGADALALEESKKGFVVDIGEAAERVAGRCSLLGNLDAVGVLEQADDGQLDAAIAAQVAAGRRLAGRFVTSLGSPITPDTPRARVARYFRRAREMGRGGGR